MNWERKDNERKNIHTDLPQINSPKQMQLDVKKKRERDRCP